MDNIKAESYKHFQKRQQEEYNSLPVMYAFGNKQFEEGMKKLGLTVNDVDKIFSIGAGGYIKKTDSHLLDAVTENRITEFESAIKSDTTGEGFCFQMFNFELGNHEYSYTHEIEPTLDALGLTMDDIRANPAMEHGLRMALREQRLQHGI